MKPEIIFILVFLSFFVYNAHQIYTKETMSELSKKEHYLKYTDSRKSYITFLAKSGYQDMYGSEVLSCEKYYSDDGLYNCIEEINKKSLAVSALNTATRAVDKVGVPNIDKSNTNIGFNIFGLIFFGLGVMFIYKDIQENH